MSAIERGAYHLATIPELVEPQRSNTFEFVITDIDGIRRAAQDDTQSETISNAQEVIRMSVKSASVPTFTQNPITIQRGNSTIKLPGTPTFSEGQVVVNDYIGLDGKSVLVAWQNLSYNPKTDKIGTAAAYKKTCYLLEYTPDNEKLVRQWVLQGCWVSGLTMPEFNHEQGNELRTVTATIQYDRGWMEMPDTEA